MDWSRPRTPTLSTNRPSAPNASVKRSSAQPQGPDWATWLRWSTLIIGLVVLVYVALTVWTSDQRWSDMWFELVVAVLLIGIGTVLAWFPRLLEVGPTVHQQSLRRIDARIGQQKRNLETSYLKRKRTLMQIQANRMNEKIRNRTGE